MIITPSYGAGRRGAVNDLQRATDTPDLSAMKDAIGGVEDAARDYYERNRMAWDWWMARWDGQTADGRRWATREDPAMQIWPWPGSSDARIRLCEKHEGEHTTIGRYALMNATVKAKANRPFGRSASAQGYGGTRPVADATGAGDGMISGERESQQATQLLNWMLYTHMELEMYEEQDLMLAWRHGFGAAITAVEWEQESRLMYVPVSMMSLGAFVRKVGESLLGEQTGGRRSEVGGRSASAQGYGATSRNLSNRELALGFMQALAKVRNPLLELQRMIMDLAYDADLTRVIQAMSPIVTKRQAEKILLDLRELRTAEVPVPYVFKSRPRRTTLRPMVDVFFPEETGDLQRAAFVDRVEYVSAIVLQDRVEMAGYDPKFVKEALDRRGPSKTTGMSERVAAFREGLDVPGLTVRGPGGRSGDRRSEVRGQSDWADEIELHHLHMLVQDRGTPVLYTTTFHMDLDVEAKHAPCEYAHGQMIFHRHRFETKARSILSSRGIPELVYTAEQEVKKQRDGRADRVDMVLRPVIFTTAYEEMAKLKAAYTPGALVPMRRFDTIEKDKPPAWDPGSTEIDNTVRQTVREFFWGDDSDPGMRELKRQELMDAVLKEEKPIVVQEWQLTQQYLPTEKQARLVGSLSRPFPVEPEDIQGQYDITITVDARHSDPAFRKEFREFVIQFASLDTMGVSDRRELLVIAAEMFSYDLADRVIKPGEAATNAEIQDEQKTFALIVGSGRPQPLPKGGNYALRMQTLQTELQQAMQTDPDFPKRIQAYPATMEVLQSRLQFFQRQLGQQENAQIGRTQVADPFTKKAPALQDLGAGLG